MKFMKFKRGISPVVATALLLVVAVVSAVGFQSWFEDFSSGIAVKSEIGSSNIASINLNLIQNIGGNLILFYHNPNSQFIKVDSVKINSVECSLVGSDILEDKSVNQIEVSDCSLDVGVGAEVVLITKFGVFTQNMIVK